MSAYSYAKLGVSYPSAGGPVEFLVKSFGDGILSGGLNILLWMGYIFALALYARAFAAYAMALLSSVIPYVQNIIATFIILIFVGVDLLELRRLENQN